MFHIQVDGCIYAVEEESSCKFGFNHDYITVSDTTHHIAGSAAISHDREDITVVYDDGSEATYNYFEYMDDQDRVRNLATWIVATNPMNC